MTVSVYKEDGSCDTNLCVTAVCSYVVPPLGMYWRYGCGKEFCVSVPLTLFGYVPGVVFAGVMLACNEPEEADAKK